MTKGNSDTSNPDDRPLAVITGGAGHLATATAKELERAGYSVLAPGRGELDVTDPESAKSFFKGLTSLKLLVNNAGITIDRTMLKLTEEDWDKVLSTNLDGAFRCSRLAAKLMMRTGGHIINIGSYSALSPPVGQANYAASKAALIGLTKSLAIELGSRDIQVNCVLPGFLETKMTAQLSDSARERALSKHVLGRFNTPECAAAFVAQLAGMPHISGQVFQLDSRVGKWT